MTTNHSRPHADLIKRWADDPTCKVWWYSKIDEQWAVDMYPVWYRDTKYAIVPAGYEDIWQAWLDGELGFRVMGSSWTPLLDVPQFSLPLSCYRRKPKQPEWTPPKGVFKPGWLAKDDDGEWYWFGSKPLRSGRVWGRVDSNGSMMATGGLVVDWPDVTPEDSLVEVTE